MSGPELREQRQRLGVKAIDLAARMGVGRTRIPQIEAQAAVSTPVVQKYINALIELAAEATNERTAAALTAGEAT